MNFYDFLVENNIDLSSFGFLLIGVFLCFYLFCWFLPVLILRFVTFFLVYFGLWSDEKRDKFMWSDINTYLYRKINNLYDEIGMCSISIGYKKKRINYFKKHKDS